jgi:hypothetical protein
MKAEESQLESSQGQVDRMEREGREEVETKSSLVATAREGWERLEHRTWHAT